MSVQKELAYRIFVTDALRNIAKNTAMSSAGGEYPSKRFVEIIDSMDKDVDTRTEEEIIAHIKDSLRRLKDGNVA